MTLQATKDGKLQLMTTGFPIDNGLRWLSGSDPASVTADAYRYVDPLLVYSPYENAQRGAFENAYFDRGNVLHRAKRIAEENEAAKAGSETLPDDAPWFKRGITDPRFWFNPSENPGAGGQLMSSAMWTAVVVLLCIILLSLAAYSLIVPDSAKTEIVKIGLKKALG